MYFHVNKLIITSVYLLVAILWFSVVTSLSAAKWFPCPLETNLTIIHQNWPSSQDQNQSSRSSLKEGDQSGRDHVPFSLELFTEFSRTCNIQITLEQYEETKSVEDLKEYMNQKSETRWI